MSALPIRAIETSYRGFRFRSRLEARWAVFIDVLGIRWEYEPEGYKMSDGTCYLPDFWLPKFHYYGLYVEVKPIGDPFDKANAFARESGQQILLADGMPIAGPWELVVGPNQSSWVCFNSKYLPPDCRNGDEYRLYIAPSPEEIAYANEEDERIVRAIYAARGARFA